MLYSLQSDNFHDFFTEYVPGATYILETLQDYEFSERYPIASTRRKGEKISDLGSGKGPHISALDGNRTVVEDKQELPKPVVEEPKQPGAPTKPKEKAKHKPASEPSKGVPAEAATKAAAKPVAQETPQKEAKPPPAEEAKPPPAPEVAPPPATKESAPEPTERHRINLLDISPNDPTIEKVVSSLNDLIKSANSASTHDQTAAKLYEWFKLSLSEVNSRLADIVSRTRAEAESEIKAQAEYFAQLHQDLQEAIIKEREAITQEWMNAFDRERDVLQERYNERLSEELKKQDEVNDSKLENELLQQAIALRRRWIREIQTQVETEREGRLGNLSTLEKALNELSDLHNDSHLIFTKGGRNKKTAIAVQALKDSALSKGAPFENEIVALKASSNNDELVRAVVDSIDPAVYSKGVISQAELASRFQSLSHELRKVALLPSDAGVAGHAASWILSKVMFRKKGYVKGDDMDSRLARIEVLLEGGQLEDATREVNSFQGWGRELSRDWLRDARRRLEVLQAIDV
jgi:MICOS complex subunit MIC60